MNLNIFDKMKRGINKAGNDIKKAGKAAGNGIKNAGKAVGNGIVKAANTVANKTKQFFGEGRKKPDMRPFYNAVENCRKEISTSFSGISNHSRELA